MSLQWQERWFIAQIIAIETLFQKPIYSPSTLKLHGLDTKPQHYALNLEAYLP